MQNLFTLIFISLAISLSAQEWQQVASMPADFRTDHSFAFGLNGKGYVATGGINGSNYSKNFYEYDAATDVWTRKDDFPGVKRRFAIGDIMDGKAYMGFGAFDNTTVLDDLWVYDPDTDEWTELASCDCLARTHPAMVALDGKVYVGLGGSVQGNLNDWWAYDVESDTWEQKADFPSSRRHHPYQFSDGQYAYVGFGHGASIYNEWYRYDPDTDQWDEMMTLPAEGRVAGTQFSHDGMGYVLSGDGDNHSHMDTGEFWQFDPQINAWNQLPPHPGRSRWAPASFILDEEVYIINGWNSEDGYLPDVYKFDLQGQGDARLRIVSNSVVNTDGAASDDYCDKVTSETIRINTPKPFDTDANITVSIDDSSTAVEGVDFELAEKTATILAGEQNAELELLIFDDAAVSGDKTIVLNMEANQIIEEKRKEVSITIIENDKVIDVDKTTQDLSFGTGQASVTSVFRGYYEDSRTQLLYTNDVLNSIGLSAGMIESVMLDISSINSSGIYNNFAVSIGSYDASALTEVDNNVSLTEVFRQTVSVSLGKIEIPFDTPIEYDGTTGLLIQFCFDNNAYTLSDGLSATEVNYQCMASQYTDGASNCAIFNGENETGNTLPNIVFTKQGPADLYDKVGNTFSSTVSEGSTIYFQQTDSIMAIIDYISGADNCIETSLLSSDATTLNMHDGLQWMERVYHLTSDNDGSEMNATLMFPDNDLMDWEAPDISIFYIGATYTPDLAPAWQTVEIEEMSTNGKFYAVTFPYQGMGSYAIGNTISTATTDLDSEVIYDAVSVFDIQGKLVSNKPLDSDTELMTGIYIHSYTYEGKVVKTKKVFVR